MVETSRDTFLAKNGTAVITGGLTYVGDLDPTNAGGMRVAFPFTRAVADTLTNQFALYSGSTVTNVVMPKAGSVIGLSVALNTNITSVGMHVTFAVLKNATVTSLAVKIGQSTTNVRYGTATALMNASSANMFAAGDRLSVRLNSDTMTTRTSAITLFVEM